MKKDVLLAATVEFISVKCKIELARFQNSSVSVLNFIQYPVPVSIGSSKCLTFGSGFRGFGFAVLTVLNFLHEFLNIQKIIYAK